MDSEGELSLVMKYYGERTDCSAFTVEEIPGSGRGLVAVREMRAGETVLVSQSAVRGRAEYNACIGVSGTFLAHFVSIFSTFCD